MKFLEFLQAEMTPPTNYSLFHIIMLLIVIGVTIALCLLFKNAKDKTYRLIVFIFWLIIVLFEIYKQTTYSTEYVFENGKLISTSYAAYSFPFQFCSSPLYAFPFIIFLKDSKLRDAFMAFTSTFVLFAGLAVMLYPNDVFCDRVGINIQTMVHHGTQVIIGIYTVIYNKDKYKENFKSLVLYYSSSIIVFAGFSIIAIALNEIGYLIFEGQTFNMFFISRHYPSTLPVLSIFYGDIENPLVPYVIYLLIYLIGFAIVSLIVFSSEWLIINKVDKTKK